MKFLPAERQNFETGFFFSLFLCPFNAAPQPFSIGEQQRERKAQSVPEQFPPIQNKVKIL